jgi:peroxiredoxin (alkyl hydroperoxide reductase subunit C)
MPIQPGDRFPSVTIKEATADGPKDLDTATLLAGKRVVIVTVPGAFTGVCSRHLPQFVASYDELKAKGADVIACLAVNDASVMRAWGEQHGALGKIVMLADGNATLTKALGIDVDFTPFHMGTRARRGAITVKDGVVESIALEESAGTIDASGAAACMARL